MKLRLTVLCLGLFTCIALVWWYRATTLQLAFPTDASQRALLPELHEEGPIDGKYAPAKQFLKLRSYTSLLTDKALVQIDKFWHPGAPIMMLESTRFSTIEQFDDIQLLLQSKLGEETAKNKSMDDWYRWIWNREYQPHPEYAAYKAHLYSRVDPRFAAYFQKTDNAKIRLDEVVWGGVKRDGIPPLKQPKMISPSQASYLQDANVVFGISINGDHRCYPKRILAWHEMFKDTIGGQSVCGVY